jgi:phytanoyl-CoA hydroxylase
VTTGGGLAAEFAEQGFVVLDGAVASDAIESLRAAADRIVEAFDVTQHRSVFSTLHEDRDRDRYFMESAEAVHCFLEEGALTADGELNRSKDKAINKIGHAMHNLVPAFGKFCRQQLFSDLLHELGCRTPELWQSMYIFKQPAIGGEVRWHQDASYLNADPPGVIGFWIAMEDADRSNGCLWIQPGGHRSPLREIYEVSPGAATGVLRKLDVTPWPSASDARPLEVAAGSVVAFSDRMPHYSSQNRSDRSRQAFTMHFTEAGTPWSPRNWLQRPTLPPFILNG